MKKISFGLLFVVILLLPGCLTGHFHRGPALVDNEMWVCDEVNLWFDMLFRKYLTLKGEGRLEL